MRVLLLGGTGLLGATLAPILRAHGHGVVVHGQTSPADVNLDLSAPGAAQALADVKPDAVINLVALTDVDACESQPDLAWRLNMQAAQVASTLGGVLVHISTDHVYDAPTPSPEGRVLVRNAYALSKLGGEYAAGNGAIVLRTNFFGPSQHASRVSFSDAVRAALSEGRAFFGFEDVTFSPLTMARLAHEIAHVLENPHPGVFNLGSHAGLSKLAFARAVAQTYGLDAGVIGTRRLAEANLAAPRPLHMVMDVGHYETTFGRRLPTLAAEIATLTQDTTP